MTATGLAFLGIRTERFEETVTFFQEIMGLEMTRQELDLVGFKLPDGTTVEISGPGDEFHAFFTTGPVVGFVVDDFDDVHTRMEVAGITFIGPLQHEGEVSWHHFRAPDGNIYEIIGR
jgi:catechol 2,3-dioxygenase-like lactoylglutathione lyase family enzyme